MKSNVFLLDTSLTFKYKLLRYFKKSPFNNNNNNNRSSFSTNMLLPDSRIDEGFQQHSQQLQQQQKYKTNKTRSLITNGSVLHSLAIYTDKTIGK
jgi:hypothetical protein